MTEFTKRATRRQGELAVLPTALTIEYLNGLDDKDPRVTAIGKAALSRGKALLRVVSDYMPKPIASVTDIKPYIQKRANTNGPYIANPKFLDKCGTVTELPHRNEKR